MGDKGNIHIKEKGGKDIYLYTHWTGEALPSILKSALVRGKGRWSDESYLTRIIFSEMIQDDVMSETGYGISTYKTDSNHEDLVVDMKNNTITTRDSEVLTFEEYCRRDW